MTRIYVRDWTGEEVRRNLAYNPAQVEGGSTDEQVTRWGFVKTFVNPGWTTDFDTACRYTAPNATPRTAGVDIGGNADSPAYPTIYPVTAGEPVTFSALVAWAFANPGGAAAAFVRFHDGSNWVGVTMAGGTAGNGQRVTGTWTVPAGATHAVFRILITGVSTTAPTDYFEYTGIIIEQRTSGPYFDGSTTTSSLVERYEWTGTPDASPSIMLAPAYGTEYLQATATLMPYIGGRQSNTLAHELMEQDSYAFTIRASKPLGGTFDVMWDTYAAADYFVRVFIDKGAVADGFPTGFIWEDKSPEQTVIQQPFIITNGDVTLEQDSSHTKVWHTKIPWVEAP